MKSLYTGNALATEILAVLGLPIEGVSEISIVCKAGQAARVTITKSISKDTPIAPVFEQYELRHKDPR